MNEFLLPEPLPLFESGKYIELPKPQWKLKTPHSPSYFANYESQFQLNPFKLAFSLPQPVDDNMQDFIQSLLSDSCPSPIPQSPSKFKFSSYFECGNLEKVYKRSEFEYDLLMKTDTNSQGYAQWFYFDVDNEAIGEIKINILNFSKRKSLFRKGMKPAYKIASENVWKYVDNTAYDCCELENGRRFYTLSFRYTFTQANEKVSFAFSIPYTFTRLKNFLINAEEKIGTEKIKEPEIEMANLSYKREVLCSSAGGLPVWVLTITAGKKTGLTYANRKGVIITARVHPGETTGSFIVENFIKFLLDETNKQSIALRNIFIFKIIPMLNPDGVVCGNYRTSLAGVDLNRQWITPSPTSHPEIYYTKNLIKEFQENHEVSIFCDLHGHAKKYNSFIYGCNAAAEGGVLSWTKVRLFPRVLARLTRIFSYKDCRFNVQQDKLGTGRVVVWNELKVTNSFTLETSFYGFEDGKEIKVYGEEELEELGFSIAKAILKFSYLSKSLEQELLKSNTWLKSKLVKECSLSVEDIFAQKLREKRASSKSFEGENNVKTKRLARNTSQARNIRIKPSDSWNSNIEDLDKNWSNYFSISELQNAQRKIELNQPCDDESFISDSSSSGDSAELRSNYMSPKAPKVEFKVPKNMMPIKLEDEPTQSRIPRIMEDVGTCFTSFGFFQNKVKLSTTPISFTRVDQNYRGLRSRYFRPGIRPRKQSELDEDFRLNASNATLHLRKEDSSHGSNTASFSIKLPDIRDQKRYKKIIKNLSKPQMPKTTKTVKLEHKKPSKPNFLVKSVKIPIKPEAINSISTKKLITRFDCDYY
ncbi:unnamed protein product [Blepharisma stoltei]|uniref:Peptidase M14 domain-containing protein n=1 Tax=Blepharisma stoltei TaxID=1481888 RepID=A0AAU9IZH5_9CILI|nr:unnamed protein product [Blepharisma stoltei]